MSEKIDTAIRWAIEKCRRVSDTARLDAEILLAHCLGKPRSYLYSWPQQLLGSDDLHRFRKLIDRRLEPTPIAYLLGEREFYSLMLKTSPATLIPRPETELLVETAIDYCRELPEPSLLELGTGTGAIAIAVKLHCPQSQVLATDISAECLEISRQNADIHAVDIEWLASDWFSRIDNSRSFDLIVSNPPYIAAADPCLAQGDLRAEPLDALSSGETGLEALQTIIASAPGYLKPGGFLMLEHGFDQQLAVENLMQAAGLRQIDCKHDLNRLPRVSVACR